MLRLSIYASPEINMGNEDEYWLVFDETSASFFIKHWSSHRKTGSQDFVSETKNLSLEEFQTSCPRIFEMLPNRLEKAGFKVVEP